MLLHLTGKIRENTYTYEKVGEEKLRITTDGVSETFDFSDVDNKGRVVVSSALAQCPIVAAVRNDKGALVVNMEKWLQPPIFFEGTAPVDESMNLELRQRPMMDGVRPPILNDRTTDEEIAIWHEFLDKYKKYLTDLRKWEQESYRYVLERDRLYKEYVVKREEYSKWLDGERVVYEKALQEFRSKLEYEEKTI